jgi:hypothetical protein
MDGCKRKKPRNPTDIKWLCDNCNAQIGWITKDLHRYGFDFCSYAVEEDTGKDLCPECFRKTPEGKTYL